MAGGKKVGVALNYFAPSKAALTWAMDHMIERRDTLVVIHVLPVGLIDQFKCSEWLQSGSLPIPLCEFKDPDVMRHYYLIKPDKEVFDMLDTVTREKDAHVIAKLYWGDAKEKLCQAVEDLHLDSIVMGGRALGPVQRNLLGSVSNYVVGNAPCPVTIVKDPPMQLPHITRSCSHRQHILSRGGLRGREFRPSVAGVEMRAHQSQRPPILSPVRSPFPAVPRGREFRPSVAGVEMRAHQSQRPPILSPVRSPFRAVPRGREFRPSVAGVEMRAHQSQRPPILSPVRSPFPAVPRGRR